MYERASVYSLGSVCSRRGRRTYIWRRVKRKIGDLHNLTTVKRTMAVTTSLFVHIVLVCLISHVTNVNLPDPQARCELDNNHKGYCVPYHQCKYDRIDKTKGELLIAKTNETRPLKKCPRLNGIPQLCCRDDAPPACGVMKSRRHPPDGKQLAQFGELPWSVALFSNNRKQGLQSSNGYFCSGSLIHPSLVLSAAHCFNNRHPREIQAHIGAYDLRDSNKTQKRNVTDIIKHQNYSDGNKNNDIALLVLREQAILGENVGTVCLPNSKSITTPKCYASGWGRNITNIYPSKLAKINVNLVTPDACQKDYNSAINIHFKRPKISICAISLKPDECAVDSGSPLVCKEKNTQSIYVQYGVLSIKPCRNNSIPGIYANVRVLQQWINTKVQELGFNTSTYTYT